MTVSTTETRNTFYEWKFCFVASSLAWWFIIDWSSVKCQSLEGSNRIVIRVSSKSESAVNDDHYTAGDLPRVVNDIFIVVVLFKFSFSFLV